MRSRTVGSVTCLMVALTALVVRHTTRSAASASDRVVSDTQRVTVCLWCSRVEGDVLADDHDPA